MTNIASRVRTASLCGLVALGLSACVVAPYPTASIYGEPDVVATMPPPAPYVETIPVVPFAGAVWINGYWGWHEGRYNWTPGRYVQPRPGYRWEPHRWEQGPRGNWHQRGGRWAR